MELAIQPLDNNRLWNSGDSQIPFADLEIKGNYRTAYEVGDEFCNQALCLTIDKSF